MSVSAEYHVNTTKSTPITGYSSAKLGAKFGSLSVIPASLAGAGVAIITTGTVTSTNALASGLIAGAATFCLCAGVGVVIGAGVGVVVGALVTMYHKKKKDRKLVMWVTRTDEEV